MHEILYNQMKLLLHAVEKVALMRRNDPGKILEIVHGDILFLMRPHRVKIKRMLDYFAFMDSRHSFNNIVNYDVNSHETSKTGTRVDQCLQFFAEIEDCNEFTSILEDNIVDVEKKRRSERRALMTQFMTNEEYLRYHEMLPKATFCFRGRQEKFKEWLLDRINIFSRPADLSRLAVTILEFLARETIENIVDMVFHIKVRKKKIEKGDDCRRKDRCSRLESDKLSDAGKEYEKLKPVDHRIIGENVVNSLKNAFWKGTSESVPVELLVDASDFSAEFKTFYLDQSAISREEVIDAYMKFQTQRKPWLYFDDPFFKNPTLICLANVDDHKIP